MQLFHYNDQNDKPARCGISCGLFEHSPVCVFSELDTNPGGSITNAGSRLINQAKEKLGLPDDTRFFEHYQWRDEMPHIDEVLVTWNKGKAVMVEWQSTDPVTTANLSRFVTFQEIESKA